MRTRILGRAHDAADGVEQDLGVDAAEGQDQGDDLRVAWERHRLARLVSIAAGVRVARRPAEADYLRARFESGVVAWAAANSRAAADDTGAWASPLELGLRAWNLWVATSMARPERMTDHFTSVLAATLYDHGSRIAGRLEDDGLVVGSHLIGDLVGLYACGVALRSAEWRAIAHAGLAAQAKRQVLFDGGGVEGSTGYTRFVAELWLAALVTARAAGDRQPEGVRAAAAGMLRFLTATMTPDGGDLRIGDDDDSCVLPPAVRAPRDVTALLPLGVALLGEPERPQGIAWSEEAAWLCGAEGYKRYLAARERPLAAEYSAGNFGLHVARRGGRGGRGGDLVALRAGPHGQQGAGGHAHNDPLSVSIWFGGRPVVCDPGTGVYLGRPGWRDRFRGVAAHATLCIDGQEPSPIPMTRPFALPDRTGASATASVSASQDGDVWRAVGTHRGWRRLGVTHVREVSWDRAAGRVEIVDRLARCDGGEGAGHETTIVIGFPLGAPGAVVVEDGRCVRVAGASISIGDAHEGSRFRIDEGWTSPRYGVVERAPVARRQARVSLPAVLITRIVSSTSES